jgi:ArsR family transcriptional regulator, arsenate/arsenite/antimonite-responsive transcriptional repressor
LLKKFVIKIEAHQICLRTELDMSADKVFEALASAARRRILAYLSQTDMTAGQVADRFKETMSAPAVSKHLGILENAGLVWREKRGQNVHYGLKPDGLSTTLVHFMGEVCPRSRPLRRESAAEAERKKSAGPATSET